MSTYISNIWAYPPLCNGYKRTIWLQIRFCTLSLYRTVLSPLRNHKIHPQSLWVNTSHLGHTHRQHQHQQSQQLKPENSWEKTERGKVSSLNGSQLPKFSVIWLSVRNASKLTNELISQVMMSGFTSLLCLPRKCFSVFLILSDTWWHSLYQPLLCAAPLSPITAWRGEARTLCWQLHIQITKYLNALPVYHWLDVERQMCVGHVRACPTHKMQTWLCSLYTVL